MSFQAALVLVLGLFSSQALWAGQPLRFNCLSFSKKTTLAVQLQGRGGLVTVKKAQAQAETFKIILSGTEGSEVEFSEDLNLDRHEDSYMYEVRQLIFPKNLFTQRPRKQFEVAAKNWDLQSGKGKLELFNCLL